MASTHVDTRDRLLFITVFGEFFHFIIFRHEYESASPFPVGKTVVHHPSIYFISVVEAVVDGTAQAGSGACEFVVAQFEYMTFRR